MYVSNFPFWNIRGCVCMRFGFFLDTRFGVPKMITSDCGHQRLVTALWNVTHNALPNNCLSSWVERCSEKLHRRLKEACYVHAPLQPLGLRSSLGYSLASVHSRGKTLAFLSWGSFWCSNCFLPNEFLKGDENPIDTISKKLYNFWMLLLFLAQAQFESPAAQRAPGWSLQRLPHLGLVLQHGSLLCTPSTRAPTTSPAGDPAPPLSRWAARGDHCHEPPQGMHGCGRHVWQPLTLWQTAGPGRDSHTIRCPPSQSSCFQAGLVFRPAGLFTIATGVAENPPGNCFFLPYREVFACPGPAAPLQPPQRWYPQMQHSINRLRGSTSHLVGSSS